MILMFPTIFWAFWAFRVVWNYNFLRDIAPLRKTDDLCENSSFTFQNITKTIEMIPTGNAASFGYFLVKELFSKK